MNLTRRPLLMGAAAASFMAGNAFAQSAADFSGEWNGALNMGSQTLRLRLVVAAGPTSTLYSVDQGNSAIPVGSTTIEGARITLAIPVIRASFTGELRNGRIEGQFTQGGTLPLTFQRGEASASAPDVLTQARLEALRAGINTPAMAAAASKAGGRSIALATGLRAVGHTQAVTTSDKWHLGSITKSMTSTLIARLAEAGRISWTDTVGGVLGSVIPDIRAEYREVTFRHLCSHRAGLQSNIPMSDLMAFPRESADSRADRIRYATLGLRQAPQGAKETTFEYSNTGYVIAGAMLETKLGAPWEVLIQEHVFNPLAMASAGHGAPGAPGAFDQPCGHAPNAAGVMEAYPPDGALSDNPAALGPAGRVHANFEDVLKYLTAHCEMRSSFLARESWQNLHTPPFGGPYAMGLSRQGNALWHNGSNTLWYAEVMFDQSRGIVAAAAANDGRAGDLRAPVGAALIEAAQAVV
ncbi:serine hydrolase domain-containing protein [Candidatus Viadribacter manganicus]|nr:serine hydrolase domain-containing protein [Candidatus Viadribacter manganicus]